MLEREKLEREVHQLRQIIRADAYALGAKSTPIADRARLQKQISIRTTMWVGLSKELSSDSSLGGAYRSMTHVQAAKQPTGHARHS
jgi:hypothetical protein